MKPEDETRRKIIREWMSLPKDKQSRPAVSVSCAAGELARQFSKRCDLSLENFLQREWFHFGPMPAYDTKRRSRATSRVRARDAALPVAALIKSHLGSKYRRAEVI
jgi:hypothetical protein